MKIIGVVVIVLGIFMTTITGFTLVTKRDVIVLGPVQVQEKEKTPIYWSPITGIILIVTGAVIVLASKSAKFRGS